MSEPDAAGHHHTRRHPLAQGYLHVAASSIAWRASAVPRPALYLLVSILLLPLLPWALLVAGSALIFAPQQVVRLACLLPAARAWYATQLLSADYAAVEAAARPSKRALFGRITGDAADGKALVVDLGAGTGVNLHSLPKERVGHLIAVEPNDECFPAAQAAATQTGLRLSIIARGAERLPLPDNTVDAVVSTFTLCSVADPTAVLREAARVLRPGGEFIFIEHVAAAPVTRWPLTWLAQHAAHVPWCLSAGGCHLTRDTEALIREACLHGLFDSTTLRVTSRHHTNEADSLYARAPAPRAALLAGIGGAVAAACRAVGLSAPAAWVERRTALPHNHGPVWLALLAHQIEGNVSKGAPCETTDTRVQSGQ